MAISLREIVTGVNSGSAASVDIGAGTQSDDLLLAFGWSDFFTLGSGFGPPSGGDWTEVPGATADLGENNSKLRAWTKTAAGGSATITLAPIAGEDVSLAVLVLAGVDLDDPVDDADNATSPGNNPAPSLHIAPSVSPTTPDAYLTCAAGTSVFNGGSTYTSPASMTERAEFSAGGTTVTNVVATEQLAASGATGTRTFAYDLGVDDPGVAVSVAIRAVSTAVSGSGAGVGSGYGAATASKTADAAAGAVGIGVATAGPVKAGAVEASTYGDGYAASTPAKVAGGRGSAAAGGDSAASASRRGAGFGAGYAGGTSAPQVSTIRQTHAIGHAATAGSGRQARTTAVTAVGVGASYGAHHPDVAVVPGLLTAGTTRPILTPGDTRPLLTPGG